MSLSNHTIALHLSLPICKMGLPILILPQRCSQMSLQLQAGKKSTQQLLCITSKKNHTAILGFSGSKCWNWLPQHHAWRGQCLRFSELFWQKQAQAHVLSLKAVATDEAPPLSVSTVACYTSWVQFVQCVYLSVFFLIGTFKICLA